MESAPQLPSNVVALGARKATVTFQPDDVDVDAGEDRSADDGLDGYGEIVEGTPADLSVGDLLLSDSSLGVWVVVESVEPDIVEDDELVIEYRELESGDEGLLTMPDTEVLNYRRPEAA